MFYKAQEKGCLMIILWLNIKQLIENDSKY